MNSKEIPITKGELHYVYRYTLEEFLGKDNYSKKDKKFLLVDKAFDIINNNKSERQRLLLMAKPELGILPSEVEKILSCSAYERKCWTDNKMLPVVKIVNSGNCRNLHLYDRMFFENLSDNFTEVLRKEYEIIKAKNLKQRIIRTQETKLKLKQQTKEIQERCEAFMNYLEIAISDKKTLLIAKLTYWCSYFFKLIRSGTYPREKLHNIVQEALEIIINSNSPNVSVEMVDPFMKLTFIYNDVVIILYGSKFYFSDYYNFLPSDNNPTQKFIYNKQLESYDKCFYNFPNITKYINNVINEFLTI